MGSTRYCFQICRSFLSWLSREKSKFSLASPVLLSSRYRCKSILDRNDFLVGLRMKMSHFPLVTPTFLCMALFSQPSGSMVLSTGMATPGPGTLWPSTICLAISSGGLSISKRRYGSLEGNLPLRLDSVAVASLDLLGASDEEGRDFRPSFLEEEPPPSALAALLEDADEDALLALLLEGVEGSLAEDFLPPPPAAPSEFLLAFLEGGGDDLSEDGLLVACCCCDRSCCCSSQNFFLLRSRFPDMSSTFSTLPRGVDADTAAGADIDED